MLLDALSALVRLNHLVELQDKGEIDAHGLRQIDRCHQTLSPELIAQFEGRRNKFGEESVVPMERGCCSGCNLTVPTSSLDEIEEDIYTCPHCDRLIYDPEMAFDFV